MREIKETSNITVLESSALPNIIMGCERVKEVSLMPKNTGFILMIYSKKAGPVPFSYTEQKNIELTGN